METNQECLNPAAFVRKEAADSEKEKSLSNGKLDNGNMKFSFDYSSTKMPSELQEEFKCPDCDSVFMRKDILNNHVENYHSSGEIPGYICDMCGNKYMGDFLLIYHEIQEHWEEGKWSSFNSKYKRCKHKKEFLYKTKIRCQNCDETDFTSGKALKEHIDKYHLEGSERGHEHQCAVCGNQFMHLKALALHEKNLHGTINGKKPESTRIFDCLICEVKYKEKQKYSFKKKGALYRHWEQVHPDSNFESVFRGHPCSKKCGFRAMTTTECQEHLRLNLCGMSSDEQTEKVMLHKQAVKKERKAQRKAMKNTVACDICQKKFKDVSASIAMRALNSHYDLVHKSHLCEHCNTSIEGRTNFVWHMEDMHSKEDFANSQRKPAVAQQSSKTLVCDICHKTFFDGIMGSTFFDGIKALNSHMSIEHKAYFCEQCNISIEGRTNFVNHMTSQSHNTNGYLAKVRLSQLKPAGKVKKPAIVQLIQKTFSKTPNGSTNFSKAPRDKSQICQFVTKRSTFTICDEASRLSEEGHEKPIQLQVAKEKFFKTTGWFSQAPSTKPQNVMPASLCDEVDKIVEPSGNSYQENRKYFSELQDHPETDPLSIPSDIPIKEEI